MPRCKYSFSFDEMMTVSLVDLQSLSSSYILRKTKPSVMPSIQSAWKAAENVIIATSNDAANQGPTQDFQLSESDFPYLDLESKPRVGNYNVSKGRRNASNQLLQKKLAGQAYVLKVVSQGQRAKAIGKKRHARLLSENCNDMGLNVPYSMNRKNLWEVENASEFLKDRRSDENVQLSALDQHFTRKGGLSPNKDVLAFHQVNEDGVLNTREAKSTRGSALAQLNSSEMEDKPLEIRYVLAKVQSNGKSLISGSIDKAKPLSRSTRRQQLDVSVYSTDNDEMNDDEILSPNSSIQSEATERMYQPKQKTYTLADFIMEKEASILVRQSRNVPLDSYVQVEMPDVQEDLDNQVPKNPITKLGHTNSLFKTFHVPVKSLGIENRDDWLRLSQELKEKNTHFRWLNHANAAFQVDLTSQLLKHTSNTPHLIATLAFEDGKDKRVRLLLNGSQECKAILPVIEAGLQIKGLEGLLQAVVSNAKLSKKIETCGLATGHGSEFNSSQLSQTVHPLNDYALLYPQVCPAEIGTKLNASAGDKAAIEEEEDDFEHIDMDQFVDPELDTKWNDSVLDDEVNQMQTVCVECGECDTSKVISIDGCGHSFCSKCLKASVHQQICDSQPVFKCTFNGCSNTIQPSILLSVFHLPVITMALHSCALYQSNQQQKRLFECPAKCGLALVDQEAIKFGQVQCAKCKQHVCIECLGVPHFPMSCEQNNTWTQKRTLQTQKVATESESEDGKKADNQINQQFWSICSEARKRRMDAQQARKIGKDVVKKVGYKLERAFLGLRLSCLQLVENGYAWLYMTRNQRPANWSSVKNLLNVLYKEYNTFENALLYGTQTADKVEDNMQKMKVMLRKAIAELK